MQILVKIHMFIDNFYFAVWLWRLCRWHRFFTTSDQTIQRNSKFPFQSRKTILLFNDFSRSTFVISWGMGLFCKAYEKFHVVFRTIVLSLPLDQIRILLFISMQCSRLGRVWLGWVNLGFWTLKKSWNYSSVNSGFL